MRSRGDWQVVLAGAGDDVVARLGVMDAAEIEEVLGVGIFQREHEEVAADLRHVQDLRSVR